MHANAETSITTFTLPMCFVLLEWGRGEVLGDGIFSQQCKSQNSLERSGSAL